MNMIRSDCYKDTILDEYIKKLGNDVIDPSVGQKIAYQNYILKIKNLYNTIKDTNITINYLYFFLLL